MTLVIMQHCEDVCSEFKKDDNGGSPLHPAFISTNQQNFNKYFLVIGNLNFTDLGIVWSPFHVI